LGIALDEPRDKDLIFHDRDITYVISKDLFEKTKPIVVDFATSRRGAGLKITSALKPDDSCGPGCGC
jgi:Fe-S cluster assembly iron-binding protein IscA